MGNETKSMVVANTVTEAAEFCRMPLSFLPTVQAALRNIELPLDREDYSWLNQDEIYPFGLQDQTTLRMSYPRNMSGPTFSFDTPTIVTGLCFFAFGEPYSTVVEGNQFGPISAVSTLPASPINVRNQASARAAMFGTAGAAFNTANGWVSPAQLDHGGPTWRMIWAFLNSFRLQFNCPASGYDIISNERLVDIGNCCSLIDFSGLSDAKTPANFITRRMNARLLTLVNNMPTSLNVSDGYVATQEPGYFVPLNSEQNSAFEITPNRAVADFAAYGRPTALPAVENWFRLPFGMPFDATTKIKLVLNRAAGDESYQTRLNDEGILRVNVGPVPALGTFFPIDEDSVAADNTGGQAGITQIPGGMLRLGIGLKGFEVRDGVCNQFRRALSDKSFMQEITNGYHKAIVTGGMGSPDPVSDAIDAHFSGGSFEQNAGYVGERS